MLVFVDCLESYETTGDQRMKLKQQRKAHRFRSTKDHPTRTHPKRKNVYGTRNRFLQGVAVLIASWSFVSFFLIDVNDLEPTPHGVGQLNSKAQHAENAFKSKAGSHKVPSLPLTAYIEDPPLPLTDKYPLPIRVQPNLKEIQYPQVSKCSDIPEQWPVDHPVELDSKFGSNVGKLRSLYDIREQYASICPVDADPFLPWIHDVFVSSDGQKVQFVAHNKRRCRTAPSFRHTDLQNLEPQVALFQSIPIQRINQSDFAHYGLPKGQGFEHGKSPNRYRLSSLEEADLSSRETRFICQFHTLVQRSEKWVKFVLGESTSVYPYNYEHANFKKGKQPHPLLTRPKDDDDTHGAHNEQIWNSVLQFSCPIPKNVQERLATGADRGEQPKVYIDLVPIRTRPREWLEGYSNFFKDKSTFDPVSEWGTMHVLPPVEESGRWANIPICTANANTQKRNMEVTKKDFLVGCVWTSEMFKTRGQDTQTDASNSGRLIEWLTYHLFIAQFDHIYIYDNSGAFSNTSSLESVINLFPSDRVSRIPWKFRVCNNNRPMHKNAGERSSQYTAETSCRLRFGPTSEWMISFDTDEYLIPQGNWSIIKEWLQSSTTSGQIDDATKILSFFQTRALPIVEHMKPDVAVAHGKCISHDTESRCLQKNPKATFLRSYDCEPTQLPKPDYGWRAKKQIYRPDFVLDHFVHYTTVTERILVAPNEMSPPFQQRRPYERRVDDINEAFMLHTKTTTPDDTFGWKERCRDPTDTKRCPVGFPWPFNNSGANVGDDGYAFNCYQHERIQKHLAGQLDTLLLPYLQIEVNGATQ